LAFAWSHCGRAGGLWVDVEVSASGGVVQEDAIKLKAKPT